MSAMTVRPDPASEPPPPRPIPETYWVVPGRLLVGEYPGSQSRAKTLDRLRRFLDAGVSCFVDLTEPWELRAYAEMLPASTRDGRPVGYARIPIPDHGIPTSRDDMQRVLTVVDDALENGHVVYVHCRAGIGRSATVAGCWLASRANQPVDALDELQRLWQQSAKSGNWPMVPETDEQTEFVLNWQPAAAAGPGPASRPGPTDLHDRIRGALLGLAAGDSAGAVAADAQHAPGQWTQHAALALCVAESLLERGRFDPRDQIERFLRWQRDGHLAACGIPDAVTADVAKALAVYGWRGQPMAGSHDPRDRSTAALPRVVAAAIYSVEDPSAAVHLAGECARTTHQSPVVIDACRYLGALLVGALRGDALQTVLVGQYEPVAGLWTARPLKPALRSMARAATVPATRRAASPDVVRAVAAARVAVAGGANFDDCLQHACGHATEPALEAALAGALWGAFHGARAIPRQRLATLARAALLESFAERLCARLPLTRDAGVAGGLLR
jgi:ADP-ribosylglycohydrolase